MLSPTNFLECFVYLDDLFTKKDLEIAVAFSWFFKERLVGNHEYTFPSIDTIAYMSKCTTRTVNRFIKKYEGKVISHKSRRHKVNEKYCPNVYEFNQEFFENILLLQECGYLRNWTKETRIHVLKKYFNNEWFLHEILYARGDMNNEMSHGFWSKCRTIKNFFLLRKSIYKVLQGAGSMNKEKKTASRLGSGLTPLAEEGLKTEGRILEGLPLTNAQKNNLLNVFGELPLKTAREAYLYKNGDNSNVNNAHSFIFMTARNKMAQMIKRK